MSYYSKVENETFYRQLYRKKYEKIILGIKLENNPVGLT